MPRFASDPQGERRGNTADDFESRSRQSCPRLIAQFVEFEAGSADLDELLGTLTAALAVARVQCRNHD
jgi:hypothetical protein